jgi:hypothetical protein
MNRTLEDLRVLLGPPSRFQIDAEPSRRKRPVLTTVRWACGCRAEGSGLRSLALLACASHAPASAPNGTRRHLPRLSSLLSRP